MLKTKKLSSLSLRRRSQIHRSLSTHACFCLIAREVLYEYLEVDGFGKGSTKRYGKLEDELEIGLTPDWVGLVHVRLESCNEIIQ